MLEFGLVSLGFHCFLWLGCSLFWFLGVAWLILPCPCNKSQSNVRNCAVIFMHAYVRKSVKGMQTIGKYLAHR